MTRFLAEESVGLQGRARTWDEAVRRAGELLEVTGNVEPSYTEEMVDSVRQNGPYIVVAPGFAFAHARPSDAVHATTLSWLRWTHPLSSATRKTTPFPWLSRLPPKTRRRTKA